jgi:hypothetical protein
MKKAFAIALLSTVATLTVRSQTTANHRLNNEESEAFTRKDTKALAQLWSDDFVVTNPLNKFVNKQAVLSMMESGFLVIISNDRQVEYVRVYGDNVIAAGSETVVWGGKSTVNPRPEPRGSRENMSLLEEATESPKECNPRLFSNRSLLCLRF